MHQWSHSEEPVPVYLTLSESRTGPAGRSAPRGNRWCLRANQTRVKVNDSWDPSQRRCGFYRRPREKLFSPKKEGRGCSFSCKGKRCDCALRSEPGALGRCRQRVIVVRLSISDAVVEEETAPFHAGWEPAACRGQGQLSREQPSWRAAVTVIAWDFQRVLDPRSTFGHLWSSCVAKAPADTLRAGRGGWLCLLALRQRACGTAVWETPAPGEAQEGVEPRSGPDMRARPLAEMLLTAVFESAYFSYYLQRTQISPTAGDCSSQSIWQTSPSLRRVSDRARTLALSPPHRGTPVPLLPKTAGCWRLVPGLFSRSPTQLILAPIPLAPLLLEPQILSRCLKKRGSGG